MGLEEWNIQQKALRDKERQNKNAATAGLNMYHGGEHDIKQHDKALKEFRLEQRQRQASARDFRGAYPKGLLSEEGSESNTTTEDPAEMPNKTDLEEGQADKDTIEDDLQEQDDDDDSGLPTGAGLVARRIASRLAAEEEVRRKAEEEEARQRDLEGGTRWTTPEKESSMPKEEAQKGSSVERRIARRAEMEEAKRKAAEEQAKQTKAEKQSAAPAIIEEDEEEDHESSSRLEEQNRMEEEEERIAEETRAQEEAAEEAKQKAANELEYAVAQEAKTALEDEKIEAEQKRLEEGQNQSQDNMDEFTEIIPGRRRRAVLEFSFGLIYPAANPVPDTETCVQAAENILPNTLPKGKELQVTFDLDTRPTVSSVEKDDAFDKEGSIRYIVKGSYAVFIVDNKEPKATTALLRRSLQTADSFRHVKPEEAVDENETEGTDELVVGEGGNQWRRIRAAEAIALEDIVDDEILTGEAEETGNES